MTRSSHLTQRYRERVLPPMSPLSDHEIDAELYKALTVPLFGFAIHNGWLWGCRNQAGYPFLAWSKTANSCIETLGPAWFWREARPFWRAAGIVIPGDKSSSSPHSRTQKRREQRARNTPPPEINILYFYNSVKIALKSLDRH